MCWRSPRVPTALTACGTVRTRASTAPRDAATASWLLCAASPWRCAGASSSPTSPSCTSGPSRRACGSGPSTVAAPRSSSAPVCSAASDPSARPVGYASAKSSSRTRKASSVRLSVLPGVLRCLPSVASFSGLSMQRHVCFSSSNLTISTIRHLCV